MHVGKRGESVQECKHGDLDLGEGGDGRWPLRWRQIACPPSQLRFSAQGSHRYYAKLKVEGGPSGVDSLACAGMNGNATPDGYFTFQDNAGGLCNGLSCDIRFTNGAAQTATVPGGVICG